MTTPWYGGGAEPPLDELLSDPIVRLLMKGDGTGENEVRRLIDQVRASLGTAAARLEDELRSQADEPPLHREGHGHTSSAA